MPDYNNGKIYMLEPNCEYETGDVYYGSTTTDLVKRLNDHRLKCNKCASNTLFEKYGCDNIKIVLIKDFACKNKSELVMEEAKYIRENKCVNKRIPLRTHAEYYQDHIDKFKAMSAEYEQCTRGSGRPRLPDNEISVKGLIRRLQRHVKKPDKAKKCSQSVVTSDNRPKKEQCTRGRGRPRLSDNEVSVKGLARRRQRELKKAGKNIPRGRPRKNPEKSNTRSQSV